MPNSPTPYVFPVTGQQVRTVDIDGEPWFVATDVCAVLEHSNPTAALAGLDDDEKGLRNVETLGGHQRLAVVSEPGLYSLILRSRKPQARAFKRWITHDVIPQIRRTGSYGSAPALPDLATPQGVLALAQQFQRTAEQLVEADARVKELEPKAAAHDTLMVASNADRLVRQVAKELGMSETVLRDFLTEERFIFRRPRPCGGWQYEHYADHRPHFRQVEKVIAHNTGPCSHFTLYVTPAGRALVVQRLTRRRRELQQAITSTAQLALD